MIYQDLLSFVANQTKIPIEDIQEQCQEGNSVDFCECLSMIWIKNTIENMSDKRLRSNNIMEFLDLQEKYKSDERDALIYSHFLYFCGILFYLGKKEKELKNEEEHIKHLKRFKEFFDSWIRKAEVSNNRLFFEFLRKYIDLIDPEIKDIVVFEEIRQCLTKDDDNIIFNTIDKEHELMMKVIDETPKRDCFRKELLRKKIFPIINPKYNTENRNKNIIKSIMHSGLAKLYFIAGRDTEHVDRLVRALASDTFPDNSFALVQSAHLLVKFVKALYEEDTSDKFHDELHKLFDLKFKALYEEDTSDKFHDELHKLFDLVQKEHLAVKVKAYNKDYLGAAEKLFDIVKNLVDECEGKGYDNQFKGFKRFKYTIKFEAILGLAYINYIKGLGRRAEKNYEEAQGIIDRRLTGNESYLQSILSINRGRNGLDNRIERRNSSTKSSKSNPIEDFQQTLEIYEKAEKEMKNELVELASLAHNNLGVYYLNEGIYDEAEEHLKQAIELNETSPHARYNLGVLYHRKGEEDKALKDRALTLIRNAANLDPNFAEAKEAIRKLGAVERKRSLGHEWFDWWFEKEDQTKRITSVTNRKLLIKLATVSALVFVIIASFGKLSYDLYLHDLLNFTHIHPQHYDIDENAVLVVVAVSITFLMLPFINKLKMGDVEIEVESAGYRPVGPASVTEGSEEEVRESLRHEFFFPRFWY